MPRLDLLAKVCARNTIFFVIIIVVFLMFSEMRNRAYLDEYVTRNRDIMQMYLHNTKICRKLGHNHSKTPEVSQEVIRDVQNRDPSARVIQTSPTTSPPQPDMDNLDEPADQNNVQEMNVVNRSEGGFDYQMMDLNNSERLKQVGELEVEVKNGAETNVDEERAPGEMYELASNNNPVQPVRDDYIRILPWFRRYDGDTNQYWYDEGLGTAVFESCPLTKCIIVNDSRVADAVLISHNYLASFVHDFQLPVRPSPNQKWVFFSWESPQHFDIKPKYWDLFNASFTYMLKSDARYPYGKIIPRPEPVDIEYDDEATFTRKKNVLWVVSNCKTDSGREDYAAELSKYIDVAIIGACGNRTCPGDDRYMCRRQLQDHYKFYLSFENSLCKEYVTEKLYDAMKTNMIPIVFGAYDYKANLPERSFIDVRDFSSPKQLAHYLKILASNKTMFDWYLRWKEKYTVDTDNLYHNGTCELCEFLHRTRDDPPNTIHLDEFWNQETMCYPKHEFLQSLGLDKTELR